MRHGVVLVSALIVSALIWALLAGLLVTVRLQHEVAIAARDHAVAREAAAWLLADARAHDWWGGAPLPAASGGDADGTCTWSLDVLDVAIDHAWYAAEVGYGRATVRIDATAYRTP
ncbi:MAG: hypothetical protein EA416_09020 [Trueperaceae bacterium]|nr:MAG: hypothetical protein EA416_09020 [Trueperaceae bacterium]